MANLNYNNVSLGGRLTGDPELKTTSSGTGMVTFNLAVNRSTPAGAEKVTDFFRCIAWGKTAEFVHSYFRKGSSILIDGQIQTGSYVDKDGVKRHTVDIAIGRAFFVDSKSEERPSTLASDIRQAPARYIQQVGVGPDYPDGVDMQPVSEELPF